MMKFFSERVKSIKIKKKHSGRRRKCLLPAFSPFLRKSYLPWPFPKQQILDFARLKEFAYDNLKFDGNGRKLSIRVENTEGKGEIACYEQFLLFPQCFQKT